MSFIVHTLTLGKGSEQVSVDHLRLHRPFLRRRLIIRQLQQLFELLMAIAPAYMGMLL